MLRARSGAARSRLQAQADTDGGGPLSGWPGSVVGEQGDDAADGDSLLSPSSSAGLLEPNSGEAAMLQALARRKRRQAAAQDSALWRVFRSYAAARAALGVALVLTPWVAALLGARPPLLLVVVCVVYAAQAISLWLLPGLIRGAGAGPRRLRWFMTIGVDMVAFSALHLLEPMSNLNYAALLVLPVLMAGVMTPRQASLATASAAAFVLLAGVWVAMLEGADAAVMLLQAGLAGIGFFVVALVCGELAQRLARQERAALGSLELARQQAELNRLVIDEMADGVMVFDRRLTVHAANPAARALLAADGMSGPAPFSLRLDANWAALADAAQCAFGAGVWPDDARELSLHLSRGVQRSLRLRARFTRRHRQDSDAARPEEVCLLFLEDQRWVQERSQRDKLATMGRISTGIAHEIRNPLAAIAQANALMLEDQLDAPQVRLARIVADNVERLKRIVDDVMEAAPGGVPQPQAIDATAAVTATCDEWLRALGQGRDAAQDWLVLALPLQALAVLFDIDHLHRVLVNLLDNAQRHASATAGAVALTLTDEAGQIVLCIASDGPPITAEVERHLFEPFFSSRSRGTGLGLYICRELCERYGAAIEYRQRPASERHRNEFRVLLKRAPTAVAANAARPAPVQP
jgi:two-component system sensor histidine kinase PilS (NtrC family)